MNNDETIEMQKRLLSERESRIEEQSKLLDGVMRYMNRLLYTEDGRAAESLLYAVYEVSVSGRRAFVAVCIDNPFIYTASTSHEDAVKDIREKIRDFYGESRDANGGLDGIEIPTHLPEDI